jgi:GDPmannose 4,6-dehydratase
MWLMMQNEKPEDFVIATGETRTVEEMVEYIFNKLELNWKDYVVTDNKYLRPEELHYLRGDPTKAKTLLGWKPKYTFENMMDEMIDYWLEYLKI